MEIKLEHVLLLLLFVLFLKMIMDKCGCNRVVEGIRKHNQAPPPAQAPPANSTPEIRFCRKFNNCPSGTSKIIQNTYYSDDDLPLIIDKCCETTATPTEKPGCINPYIEDGPEGPIQQPGDNTALHEACGLPGSSYYKNKGISNPRKVKQSDCKACAAELTSCSQKFVNDFCGDLPVS